MSDNTTDNDATADYDHISPETVNEEDTSNEDNKPQDTTEVVADGLSSLQLSLNIPNDADIAAAEYDNEFLSLLPPSIIPRIDKLKALNDKRDEILEEYRLERAALEMKFHKKMDPLFEERRGVINGEFDDTIGTDTTQTSNTDDDEGYEDVAEEGVVEEVNEEDDDKQKGRNGNRFCYTSAVNTSKCKKTQAK